jgi:hypothetical protein
MSGGLDECDTWREGEVSIVVDGDETHGGLWGQWIDAEPYEIFG